MYKNIILFVAFFLCFLIFYKFVFHGQSSLVGTTAPRFQTADLENHSFDLNDVIKKKVILINFWATWCEPCRHEIPVLNQIYQELPKDRFTIISLMQDEAPTTQALQEILTRFTSVVPIHFPVYLDSDGAVADKYGTYKIPESYLVDLSGNIIYKHYGIITRGDKEKLVNKIKEIIGG